MQYVLNLEAAVAIVVFMLVVEAVVVVETEGVFVIVLKVMRY